MTANGRPAPLLDVPASTSVYGSETLRDAGIATVKLLAAIAPSLGVINAIGETFGQLLRVRGVATSGADIGLESATAVMVDGVPLSRPNLAIGDLQGVEKVEFLRGPQGTLFGKNATAGVINVVTMRPSFVPELAVSATAGNLVSEEFRWTATGPLVGQRLAARLDAVHATRKGAIRNMLTGATYGGMRRDEVRAQGLWAPSAAFALRVIADYLDHDGRPTAPAYRVVGSTGPLVGQLGATALAPFSDPRPITLVDAKSPRFDKNKEAGASAHADWAQGDIHVTGILSYRTATFARDYDVDGGPADLLHDPRDGEDYRTFTAESRIRIRRGIWDHLAGAYFSRELVTSRDSYTVGADFETYANALAGGYIALVSGLPPGRNYPAGSGVLDVFRQRSTEAAIFAHEIVDLTPRFSLTAGLRYATQSKSLDADLTTRNPGCSAALAKHGAQLSGVPPSLQTIVCVPNLDPRYDGSYATDKDEEAWSGTVAVLNHVSENATAYLSYSRGYKSGGFQLDRSGMSVLAPALSEVAFGAEFADSYEAGAKGFFLEHALSLAATAFYTDFINYQLSYFTGFNRRTKNVPHLVTKGAELELGYVAAEHLEFRAAATYQEVIFGDTDFPVGLTQLQGATVPLAPRWTLVATARYEQPLADFALVLREYLDVRWQSASSVGASAVTSADFRQGAYALVGGRLALAQTDGPWSLELWARNLLDQKAWALLYNTTLQPGSISGFVVDPRSWGVTLAAKW